MGLIAELPPAHAWKELGFPDKLGSYLDWAEGAGAKGLLWPSDPAQAGALESALRGRNLPLTVVLPNMPLYARDAMDAGPTGAVLKRFRRLSPLAFVKLGLRLLPRAPDLLQSASPPGSCSSSTRSISPAARAPPGPSSIRPLSTWPWRSGRRS
ncbi:MAG: hypothetical protein M0D55_18745 [Elusimicrobiota bacterium]|nr:MAG: hypothetical protein M0D55_18745 [Elusimicrobiota bacterium]